MNFIVERSLERDDVRIAMSHKQGLKTDQIENAARSYVTAHIYKERKATSVKIAVYATWWDHFKASCPRFMRLKFNTKIIEQQVHFDVLYPEFKAVGNPERVVVRSSQDIGMSITEVYGG